MSSNLPHRISDLSRTCLQRMRETEDELRSRGSPDTKLSVSLVNDGFDRFRLWAGNIGAIYVPSRQDSSLDLRLREVPMIADEVVECLKDLLEDLDNGLQIMSGKRQNRLSSMEFYEDVYDDEGHTDAVNAETEELSEIFEIFQTTQTMISCLFRLSHVVRTANKRDRYITASRKREDPYDELLDIAHVGHKYPKLRETPWLEVRLGRAITRRREAIRYSKEHHHKSARGVEQFKSDQARIKHAEDPPIIPDREKPPSESRVSPSYQLQSSLGSTKASTLDPDKVMILNGQASEDMIEDQATNSSYATTEVAAEGEEALKIPPIPEAGEEGKEFLCPYCWIAVCFKGNSKRRRKHWKQHVLQDLRPFICTFPSCDLLMFPDMDTWFEHELKKHRNEWSCPSCSTKPFDSAQSYEVHLEGKHGPLLDGVDITTLLKTSEQAVSTIKSTLCPFCNPSVEDEDLPLDAFSFKIHVGRHMQQLALFALPRVSDVGEDSWESDKAALIMPDDLDDVQQDLVVANTEPLDPPMHRAAYEGNGLGIVRMLKAGINIDATGSTWGSVLGAAIAGGHPAVVKLLVESGADLQLPCKTSDEESTTALQAAAARKNSTIHKMILSAENRMQRPLIYGKLTWRLESVATKLETLASRYDQSLIQANRPNIMMLPEGYEELSIIGEEIVGLSKTLREIGTMLDPESDSAAANFKDMINPIHIYLNGLEICHDIIDFIVQSCSIDKMDLGLLTPAASHCISHFNQNIVQTIFQTDKRDSLHTFIRDKCEEAASLLWDRLKRYPDKTWRYSSEFAEQILRLERLAQSMFEEIRHDVQKVVRDRESSLRYYNTYQIPPEGFYRLKAADPMPAHYIQSLEEHAADRAAVDIVALARASAKQSMWDNNLPSSLQIMSNFAVEQVASDMEVSPTAIDAQPANPDEASDLDIPVIDQEESREDTAEALQNLLPFMIDIGRNTLRKLLCIVSPNRLLTLDEKSRPIHELWDPMTHEFERFQAVLADCDKLAPSTVAADSNHKNSLLDLCQKLHGEQQALKQQIIDSAEPEPMYSSDLDKFFDKETMAKILRYRSMVMQPLKTAVEILRESEFDFDNAEHKVTDHPTWSDKMEYFEWRADTSLSHMLNEYLLIFSLKIFDTQYKEQLDIARKALERLQKITERQLLFP